MIMHEDKYCQFLVERGTGKKDQIPGRTIASYVARLNGISEKIGRPISPELFNGNFSEQGFSRAWNKIAPIVAPHFKHPRTLGDCKSNFKRYWEMLVEYNLTNA